MLHKVYKIYKSTYNSEPKMYRAPARINIIGEHTDYNNGFVLPTAISKEVYFAIDKNASNYLTLFSEHFNQSFTIEINKISIQKENSWANYFLGVLAQLQKRNIQISGVQMAFGSTIPIGAGVSSSAALECGFVYALNDIFNLNLSLLEMAQIAQLAEHEYAGVKCGIMDQYAVLFSKINSVIKLDCKTQEHTLIPFTLPGYSIVLCNTGVSHNLASSEYNKRRAECTEGVRVLKEFYHNIQSLRDVTLEQLKLQKSKLQTVVYNRCLYVVSENNRVLEMCNALENTNLDAIKTLLYQSHNGLQCLYEVSCAELDILVEIAKSTDFVLGARMMGGGFGGCTLNIVKTENLQEFKDLVIQKYYIPHKKNIQIIEAEFSNGVSSLEYNY